MKFAVYHYAHGWLVDTGVGGTYSPDVEAAQWWDLPSAALNELVACDIVKRGSEVNILFDAFVSLPHAAFFIIRVK